MAEKGRDPVTGRFLPGNTAAKRTGAYSKRLPVKVKRQVECVRAGLVEDLAGREEDLTTAQRVLIDKAAGLLGVTATIEMYVRRHGVFKGKRLDPVLGSHYIAYVNALRLVLRELGITRKQSERILTPFELADLIDKEKREQGGGGECR